MRKKRRRKNAPAGTPDPALQTFNESLSLSDEHIEQVILRYEGDPSQNLAKFRDEGWADMSTRAVGHAAELALAYANVDWAALNVSDLAKRLEPRGHLNMRAAAAGRNVIAAAVIARSALLTHLREDERFEYATCALLRTSIELAGRAVFIARGSRDEASCFNRGATLHAADALIVFDREVATREPSADPPSRVYKWLCGFTHVDVTVMNKGADHEHAYSAMAYVAWANAVAAEVIVGFRQALLPKIPPTRPW